MKGSSSNNLQQMQQHNQQSQDSGCKIFVGGLTWNTTKEMLYTEFSKYGEIVDSIVMKNPETGNSRGFGFVTYKENVSAESAVAAGSHKVDGKIVDVKLCNPRLAAQQRNIKQRIDNCKVFVGGLPHGVTDEQIKQFFARYGPVKEFKMMYDENKQRPRGFGFITFESEESANQVLQEHYIQFNGKQIEVKPQIHNIRQQLPYHHQPQMHYQQTAHFSGANQANWNTQWNQSQQPQQLPQSMPNPNYAPIMQQHQQQGYNPNQQWGGIGSGYPGGHGSQQMAAYATPNDPSYSAGGQSANWNYQYYGQQQPYYQQPAEITGTGI